MLQAVAGEPAERAVAEGIEPLLKSPAQTGHGVRASLWLILGNLADKGMAKMGWQDHKTLQQRGNQHADHHHRNIAQDIAYYTSHHQQWHERRHRGQGRSQYWPDHTLGSAFGGIDGLLSHTGMGVRVLPHHDGIVNDHPQGHDQGKQGNHVDGAADQP